MRDIGQARRQNRTLVGVVAASALVYPMLLCAVRLVFAQIIEPDPVAAVCWGTAGVASSVGVAAVVRWSVGSRVLSPWLLTGLVPPALFELYLYWPYLTG